MHDKKTISIHTEVTDSESLNKNVRSVGKYMLLEVIGEGGMGTVFLAQQDEPIRRKVALKIIKSGMNSKDIIARFESERQVLALLNHPNITQIFDAGTTEQGYPYFVMEYLPGIPITAYCDKYKMPLKARLDLFRIICDAIQHAHFKGIVHRDIKPSNILVSCQNDKPVIKIIDFGVAKALYGQKLTEHTLHTNVGLAIGTPVYMSPEQAELSSIDIDTRSDIYSLGVLLYELLVGVTPFDKSELNQAGFMEIMRVIREVEPLKPSTRFSSLGNTSTEIAKKRGTSGIALARELKGDIDWIIMKSLEKDRRRRYNAASEFAEDINRFIKQEPIIARPPDIFYKARKYIRRNKVITFSLLTIAVLFIVFLLWNITERSKTERALRGSYYNFAIALKEKAAVAAEKKEWSNFKLFSIGSLWYQIQANKFFPIEDTPIPFNFQLWILKNAFKVNGFCSDLSQDGESLVVIKDKKIFIYDTLYKKIINSIENEENVKIAKFSPKKNYLVIATDKEIQIRTSFDINRTIFLKRGLKRINNFKVSPDELYLVLIDIDETCEILSFPDLKTKFIIERNISKLETSGLDIGGGLLALSSRNTIRLFELKNGLMKSELKGSTNFEEFRLNEDGQILATADIENVIRIWDIQKKQYTQTFRGHNQSILSLDFTNHEKNIVSSSFDNTVKIWDIASGDLEYSFTPTNFSFVHIGDEGKCMAIENEESKFVQIWRIEGKDQSFVLNTEPGDNITSTTFSPDGKYIASGTNMRNKCFLWEFPKGGLINKIENNNPIKKVSFDSDGKYLLTLETKKEKFFDSSLENKVISRTSKEKTISIWNVPELSLNKKIRFSCEKNLDVFSADGHRIASVEGGQNKIIVRDTFSGEILARLSYQPPNSIITLFFSVDGRFIISLHRNNRIIVWGLSYAKKILELNDIFIIKCAAISPSDSLIVTGGDDQKIKIWDVNNGKQIGVIGEYQRGISQLCFSRDGKYLSSYSLTGVIKVWDFYSKKLLLSFSLIDEGRLLSFSPDGSFLVLNCNHSSLKIWDVNYFIDSLWGNIKYPYDADNVKQVLVKTETETGHILDGIATIEKHIVEDLGSDYIKRKGLKNALADYELSVALEDSGQKLIDVKKYKQAIADLEKSLMIRQSSVIILNALGFCCEIEGLKEKSVLYYIKAKAIDPVFYVEWNTQSWNDLGNKLLDNGEFKKSIDSYCRAIEFDPNNFYATNNIGIAHRFLRQFDEAIKFHKKAIKINPNYFYAWYNLGLVNGMKSNFRNAIGCFLKSNKLNSNYLDSWNWLALAYLSVGDNKKALDAINKAFEIDRFSNLTWERLYFYYHNNKDKVKQAETIRKAIESQKEYCEITRIRKDGVLENLANWYLLDKDIKKSIDSLKQAVDINPLNAYAWFKLGNNYTNQNKNKNAIIAYKKSISIKPNADIAYNNLGWAYYLEEEYKNALSCFKQSTDLNHSNYMAQFNTALTYLTINNLEMGYDQYLTTLGMNTINSKKSERPLSFFDSDLLGATEDVENLIRKKPNQKPLLLIRGLLNLRKSENKSLDNNLKKEARKKAEYDLKQFLADFKGDQKWKEIAQKWLVYTLNGIKN